MQISRGGEEGFWVPELRVLQQNLQLVAGPEPLPGGGLRLRDSEVHQEVGPRLRLRAVVIRLWRRGGIRDLGGKSGAEPPLCCISADK